MGQERPNPDRLIIFEKQYLGRAGITDRLVILGKALEFAVAMNATLLFPIPCEILTFEHSREIANCSSGWDYYVKSTHYFVGLHGSDNSSDEMKVNIDGLNTTSLTPELLESIEQPPTEPFFFVFPYGFYSKVGTEFVKATHRLIKNRKDPFPQVSVFSFSDPITSMAVELMNSLNLSAGSYGAIKIRRRDRTYYYNCTEPKAVVNHFLQVYDHMSEDDRTIKWLVFGYVESSYWGRLAEELFLSPPLQGWNPPKFLFERDLHFRGENLDTAIADNYVLMLMILHIMHSAKYTIGTYSYEGKHGHLCRD